jgi:hypothetical protein
MSLEFLPSLCPFSEAKKELVEDIFNKSGKPSYCNYKAKSQVRVSIFYFIFLFCHF